tara:strand:- start:272 stop:529 length:258 start_codon:yes stop_codon:yes gene_type:complete
MTNNRDLSKVLESLQELEKELFSNEKVSNLQSEEIFKLKESLKILIDSNKKITFALIEMIQSVDERNHKSINIMKDFIIKHFKEQ